MEFFVQFTYTVGFSLHGPFSDPEEALAFSVNPVFKNYDFVQSDIINVANGFVNDPKTSLISAYIAKGLEIPAELIDPEPEEVVAPE